MKIPFEPTRNEQGGVLIVALTAAFILGATLCSYLVLTQSEDQSVSRSQSWNASLDVAEAGIEEGLAQMNSSTGLGSTNSLSSNGWGLSATTYGPVTRNLSGGSYSVSFVTTPSPMVYSTGYVTVPVTGATVSRKVKLTAVSLPLINVPLGAIYNIDFNGNGAATDSWNSYDTNLSLNGTYDSSRVHSNGSVASVEGAVNIGNHTILGNLYLGPNATYASSTNLVTGTVYYDYNVEFPDVVLPNYTWWPSPALTNGVHEFNAFNTTLGKTNFVILDNAGIVVKPGIIVTLDVKTSNFQPGSVSIEGGFTNAGKLTVYQESGTASISGNGSGPGSRPDNFWYYGLTNVTGITLSGNTAFLGVIYAPEASLTLNGGGNSSNLEGAAIVKQVKLNGHYDFHFDESLLTNGPVRGYVPASWQEF